MSVHVEIIPNHGRKPSILLRRAWREGKKIRPAYLLLLQEVLLRNRVNRGFDESGRDPLPAA